MKTLKFAYLRNGKPTGRVKAVVDPNTIDLRADSGIPRRRAQNLVSTLEASTKWERVSSNTAEDEGKSTRKAEAAKSFVKADMERKRMQEEQSAVNAANAKAIADALRGSK